MSQSFIQAYGDSKPIFIHTIMDVTDPVLQRSCLQGPEQTGLPQVAIDVIATGAKSRGDAHFKRGEWQQARDAYLEAAVFLTSDPKFHATTMLNGAAASLQLKNWGEVLSQTGEVLDEDHKSIKALYRAARALNELEKFEEALDCSDRALALEPHNKPLQEERRTAERGFRRVQKNILSILLNAYEHHHLRIINEQSPPPFQPGFLPYFDPPHPGDFKKAPLLCTIRILYVERHATDKISNFPSNIPLSQLFEVLLPGPGVISSAVPRLQSSPETKLIPLRNLRYRDRFPDGRGIDHPKVWDPELEYLPTTVSVYAEVHNEKSIRIEAGETLGDVFMKTKNIKAVYQDEEKSYIEIGEGMISLYAFRQGSEAETKWQTRTYSSVTDLTDPGYEVSSESSMVRELITGRSFCFGPLMRATNLPNSASYAARRTILMGKDRLLDSGERSEEYGTDAQDIERKYMRAMFK